MSTNTAINRTYATSRAGHSIRTLCTRLKGSHTHMYNARVLSILAALATAACAPIYIQPSSAGNSQIRYAIEGDVELLSIQYWLNGRECTDRLRVTTDESKAFEAGGPIVISSGKEFAATLQATRKVSMSGGIVYREVCDAGASFVPQPDSKYVIVFVANQSRCAVDIRHQIDRASVVPQNMLPEVEFRRRKVQGHNCSSE